MRVATFKRWRGLGWGFEGVREVSIPLDRAAPARGALDGPPFRCRRGGPEITMRDCLACEHFVNWRPEPEAGRAVLRCLFTDSDPVRDLMTNADAIVTVDPEATVAETDEIARQNDVRHLLVARGEDVIGVLCRCDLTHADRGAKVGVLAATPPWCVRPEAMLCEVATLFRNEGIGLALVVDGEHLVGVITRGDLRRAGCPEEMLGAQFCASCRSSHGVLVHPALGVDICLDCLEASGELDVTELGEGD